MKKEKLPFRESSSRSRCQVSRAEVSITEVFRYVEPTPNRLCPRTFVGTAAAQRRGQLRGVQSLARNIITRYAFFFLAASWLLAPCSDESIFFEGTTRGTGASWLREAIRAVHSAPSGKMPSYLHAVPPCKMGEFCFPCLPSLV